MATNLMPNSTLTPSTVELLRWISACLRSYGETMDAWRTSCPRLTIWEDALIEGLVKVTPVFGGGARDASVMLTSQGRRAIGLDE
jgi:hypothetical protein